MTTGRTLAITGLVAGVAVLAFGISHTGFTIRQPEYALSVRHCLSYERKGHVQAFCAMTRRYCEQNAQRRPTGELGAARLLSSLGGAA